MSTSADDANCKDPGTTPDKGRKSTLGSVLSSGSSAYASGFDNLLNARGKTRPRGIIEDTAADGNVLTLLDAATKDLAHITQLNLNATLGTPSPGRGFIGRRVPHARTSARCARTPRAIAKAPPRLHRASTAPPPPPPPPPPLIGL
ncbi:hypothetical protein B0H13DRAFT_2310610 [Mycena leptocephala]|nr:hypothetical protein B0H13DRAFT_2310610 [Mycena leptocephala]